MHKNIDDDQGEINGTPQDIMAQVPQKFPYKFCVTRIQAKNIQINTYMQNSYLTHLCTHMSWAQGMLS